MRTLLVGLSAIGFGLLGTPVPAQPPAAKSDRRLSMKATVPLAEVLGPADQLELLALAEPDLRAAGGIGRLDLLPGRTDTLVVACAF